MSTIDIQCKICKEWFSWDYPEDLVRHEHHNAFVFMMDGKEYIMDILFNKFKDGKRKQ